MNFLLKMYRYFFIFSMFALLQACGSGDGGKVSKGHRDAIKYECKDSSDVKACGLEVRENFIEDGNDFVTFEDLSKEETKQVKLDCMRSKKFGLEPYNNCLDQLVAACLDGNCFLKGRPERPSGPIETLEESTVIIVMFEDKGEEEPEVLGAGSGVILDNDLIATNCHVTNAILNKSRSVLMVKNVNAKTMDSASVYKRAPEHDICIIKKDGMTEFSLQMRKIKKYIKFEKLSRGDFVRTIGTPQGLEGHSAEGKIQYLGTAGKAGWTQYGSKGDVYTIAKDTKIIEHSARIDSGSSGGPLFDKNGHLVGLNTFGSATLNFSISADHIRDLLKRK